MSLTDRELRPEEHGFGPPPEPEPRLVHCADCGKGLLRADGPGLYDYWVCEDCSQAAANCAASRIPRWILLTLPWLVIGACTAALSFA
jgi:hypothetical protein